MYVAKVLEVFIIFLHVCDKYFWIILLSIISFILSLTEISPLELSRNIENFCLVSTTGFEYWPWVAVTCTVNAERQLIWQATCQVTIFSSTYTVISKPVPESFQSFLLYFFCKNARQLDCIKNVIKWMSWKLLISFPS